MKRINLLFSAALLSLCALNVSAADKEQKPEPKNNFKLYGFIRNYFAFDSRESISGTGDIFYYLPKDVSLNEAGEDVNAVSSFRFLALTSRLGVDVSGYSIGNVHFGAKIEGDFYAGLSNSSNANAANFFPGNTKISGTATARLRQAFATVTWKELGAKKSNSVIIRSEKHRKGAFPFPKKPSMPICRELLSMTVWFTSKLPSNRAKKSMN